LNLKKPGTAPSEPSLILLLPERYTPQNQGVTVNNDSPSEMWFRGCRARLAPLKAVPELPIARRDDSFDSLPATSRARELPPRPDRLAPAQYIRLGETKSLLDRTAWMAQSRSWLNRDFTT
jgi:hypothetical protein